MKNKTLGWMVNLNILNYQLIIRWMIKYLVMDNSYNVVDNVAGVWEHGYLVYAAVLLTIHIKLFLKVILEYIKNLENIKRQ